MSLWEQEDCIMQSIQVVSRMSRLTLFREVTEAHVLAYRYRTDLDLYSEPTSEEPEKTPSDEVFSKSLLAVTGGIKKVERMFEMLSLQLPCEGQCPLVIASAFGPTVCNIALRTGLMWNEGRSHMIKNILYYFAGRGAVESFDDQLMLNDELESLVLARLPYARSLYLCGDHFVLSDVEISSELRLDLRNKVRYIDTVLAKRGNLLNTKEKNLIEGYYSAREICVKSNFVQNKNNLPDISNRGESNKTEDATLLLRHLLRVMCHGKNMRKMEADDKFFQFLMQLHEALYGWTDTAAMLEVLERVRANIVCYLKGLTSEQLLLDKELTKAKLEHFERELYRHLNYLTTKQVALSRGRPVSELRPAESESSIYTMAMSASTFMMQRQATLDRQNSNDMNSRHVELDMMHQQRSLDQSSIVSGSSVYAPALSVCSGQENVPLLQQRINTPVQSPLEGHSPLRAKSPLLPSQSLDRHHQPPLIECNEYYETAV